MSNSYSKIPKVSSSGKARDIGSTFLNTLIENPQEYTMENGPDKTKMTEAYIKSAKCYGVILEWK